MRLIVGLGNPGARYQETPHNAGFRVVERFSERHHFSGWSRKFAGLYCRGPVGELEIAVLKPMTYMNLSGDSVAQALRYLPVEHAELCMVWDDIELPMGRIRIRRGGGHGGHNGVRSIIERIGSRDFARLRVGIGRPEGRRDPTPHLLSRLPAEMRQLFTETLELAVEALGVLLEEGVEEAMNRYNGLPARSEKPEEKKT